MNSASKRKAIQQKSSNAIQHNFRAGEDTIDLDPNKMRFVHKQWNNRHAHGGVSLGYMVVEDNNAEYLVLQIANCNHRDTFNKRIAREICRGRMKKHGPAMILNISESASAKFLAKDIKEKRAGRVTDSETLRNIAVDAYLRKYITNIQLYLSLYNDMTRKDQRSSLFLDSATDVIKVESIRGGMWLS